MSDTYSKDQQPAWPLVTRLWRTYLHKHIGWMAVAFILMTIEGASTGLFSYMLKPVFDNIFVAGELDALWWVGSAILLIFTVRAVVGVLNRMIVMRISQRCSSDMQVDLVGHVLHLDSVFFQANAPGAPDGAHSRRYVGCSGRLADACRRSGARYHHSGCADVGDAVD